MANRMVTVARFSDPLEASLARNLLVDSGVPSVLNNDESAVMLGINLGTVELLVAESDLETAREVLRYPHLSLEQVQRRTEIRHPDGILEPDFESLHRTAITTADAVSDEEGPIEPREEKNVRTFEAWTALLMYGPFVLLTVLIMLTAFLRYLFER